VESIAYDDDDDDNNNNNNNNNNNGKVKLSLLKTAMTRRGSGIIAVLFL
jgi:hypothetical protein